jgi:hypothetical protein
MWRATPAQRQNERRRFQQSRTNSTCDLEQGNKQNQANRKMHDQRMEAAQELLPIRVRLSVQPEN